MSRWPLRLRPERFLAVLLVACLTLGALSLRFVGDAPTRLAMAAAPDQGLYLATDSLPGFLYLLGPTGDGRRVSALPGHTALSLAASGRVLLLGMEGELALSRDGGRTWMDTGVPGRHFIATSLSGPWGLAADWGRAIWYTHDGGLKWERAAVASAYLQITSLLIAPGGDWYATSEISLLKSSDRGATWTAVSGLPDRLTALSYVAGRLYVGTWRGQVLAGQDGFQPVAQVKGGVWATLGSTWIATTSGLYQDGRPAPLPRSEFVSLAESGSTVYAGTAGGSRVWALSGSGWKTVFAGG